jgi:hypothetical protein
LRTSVSRSTIEVTAAPVISLNVKYRTMPASRATGKFGTPSPTATTWLKTR